MTCLSGFSQGTNVLKVGIKENELVAGSWGAPYTQAAAQRTLLDDLRRTKVGRRSLTPGFSQLTPRGAFRDFQGLSVLETKT